MAIGSGAGVAVCVGGNGVSVGTGLDVIVGDTVGMVAAIVGTDD